MEIDFENLEDILFNNIRYFKLYNEKRRLDILETLPITKSVLFICLPYLLHTNHEGLPGYIPSNAVPFGIYNFNIRKDERDEIQSVLFSSSPSDLFFKPFVGKPAIESLTLMGSIGSVAHTRKSDFDYWIIIDSENLPSHLDINLLTQKADLLVDWAYKTYKVFVSLFIVDKKDAQKNIFGHADSESCGSALGKLLKEEFYRTMFLVKGKVPLWWICPAGISDSQYLYVKDKIKDLTRIFNEDLIDIGHINNIPVEEFFGAFLWQMNKAMEEPDKSIIKMGLLEKYITEAGKVEPLSITLKRKVLSQQGVAEGIDPYFLLVDEVLNFYRKSSRDYAVALLQRAFYLKMGVKITYSEVLGHVKLGRRQIAAEMIRNWGWNRDEIELMNSFENWEFNRIIAFGNQIIEFMGESYKKISAIHKEMGSPSLISDMDLTVLGGKIFSLYQPGPRKIARLKTFYENNLAQLRLTIHYIEKKNKKNVWELYTGSVSKDDIVIGRVVDKRIYSSEHIVDILIWAYHNKIYTFNSSINLIPSKSYVGLVDILDLLKQFNDFFPSVNISDLGPEIFLSTPELEKLLLIINFEESKWTKKLKQIDLIYNNNRGELFHESYNPNDGLKRSIEIIKTHNLLKQKGKLRIFIPKDMPHDSIKKEIISNFRR